jgi:hypothetical protein
MVDPILPAISAVLLLFQLSAPFLFLAFFAAIAHWDPPLFSLKSQRLLFRQRDSIELEGVGLESRKNA